MMPPSFEGAAGEELKTGGLKGGVALVAVFIFSFVSFGAVMLSLASVGELGNWTEWQFVGLFGVIEFAAGLAAIVAPNVWRLPVAQVRLQRENVELAASTTLMPHWTSSGRVLAGSVMIVAAAIHAGVRVDTLLLLPFLVLLAIMLVEVATLFAYAGVRRPDVDVIQLAVYRDGKEIRLPPLSIGASTLHVLINMAAIPVVYVVSPALLFAPEMRIAPSLLAVAAVVAFALALTVTIVWRHRLAWEASPAQQREAKSAS